MTRKLSEKQKELLSLTTRVDAELTQQQRILLGYIIYKYNDKSDSVKENGYTHDSRDTIKKECGIGSDTLKTAIVKLENEGLITCERGIAHKQNTRFALTQKTLDAIASHEASYIASYTENSGSSLLEELLNEMKTMRLAINELVEDKKKLIEEVEKLNEKVNRTLEIEVGIEQSCNSSCNQLSNINNSSQNTIPERSCTGDVDGEVFQIEPVKRKKSTGVVSSSLQIIEEENHPDTRTDADGVTIPSNESISNGTEQPDEAEKSSSKKGQSETDRFTLSQSGNAENPPQVAPLPPLKQYEEVLSDISRWVDMTVEEQISKEDENRKLLNEASRRRGFDIAAEVHELMRPKAIELGELYPDYYDTYKNLNGFVSLGKFIKDAESRVLLHLRELHDQKAHVKMYPDIKNGSIILREAS